ncbi:MAG: hypothetical protein Q4C70_13890 [Planctomycetia bacterium]|nr:hypothetical protein [Planctomycetia bacterium]
MKKVSFKIFSGMAAALCSVAMFSAVNAADELSLDEFDLDITEAPIAEAPAVEAPVADTLEMDDLLAAPPLEDVEPVAEVLPAVKAVEPAVKVADVAELEIAQAPAEAAPVAEVTPVTEALETAPAEKVLAAPAVEAVAEEAAPVADALPVPVAQNEIAAPVKAAPATKLPTKLPVAEPAPIAQATPKASIVENGAVAPANVAAVAPIAEQPLVQGTVAMNGNCRNCQKGLPRPMISRESAPVVPYVTYPGPGRRGIIYDAQPRNGVHAYPRRECPGCNNGCPSGNCRGAMPYSYYTLRGPRDFDDPNPRPIGP